MMKSYLLGLAIAAILYAAPTRADEAATVDDTRCLLVSMRMMEMSDPAIKSAGTMSTMYWMGRLDGRTPDLKLEDQLIAEIGAMKQADYQTTATRCAAVLSARGKFMTDMATDMHQKILQLQKQQTAH
jgi:hypothetical protein